MTFRLAEMVCSALVEQGVSGAFSYVLGKDEKKVAQGHIIRERLEMAANELEFALERSARWQITDVSLLQRRKMIWSAYVEATELLDKHGQGPVQGQGEIGQGMKKRKLWMFWSKDPSASPSFVGLDTDDVRRLERFAGRAREFVRDVESGCSLLHYTFCNSLVRHLLEGKTVRYTRKEQGNWLRHFSIWPFRSDERGVEAFLEYYCNDDIAMEKSFHVRLIIRLSESTDIVGVAIKCLELLTSPLKLKTESVVGELTLLANLQDISTSYAPPWVGIQESRTNFSDKFARQDPACCKAWRLQRHCDGNTASSELSHIYPEQVILLGFKCYMSALEYRLRSSSDLGVRAGWRSPLKALVLFFPHHAQNMRLQCSYAVVKTGNIKEYRDASSIQQVAEIVRSDANNGFFLQSELTVYELLWYTNHGGAFFAVEKPSARRAGGPKTRRYNTRGSAKRGGSKSIRGR